METEIERRFLVIREKLPDLTEFSMYHSEIIKQAYLAQNPWVRVRIVQGNTPKAILTVKGEGTLVRAEVNCPIPLDKANEMWSFAKYGIVHKIRRHVGRWEIDEFTDNLTGLWLAEIELGNEHELLPERPEWLGQEVTEDVRYSNAHLAVHGLPR